MGMGDIVSVSMDNDCLAAGSSSEMVQVWRPRTDDNSNIAVADGETDAAVSVEPASATVQ